MHITDNRVSFNRLYQNIAHDSIFFWNLPRNDTVSNTFFVIVLQMKKRNEIKGIYDVIYYLTAIEHANESIVTIPNRFIVAVMYFCQITWNPYEKIG